MNIVENIRRIGIFMIAAQTVMHFAAGKQYEKYMKIIAGVIVLLMFITPFVSSTGELAAKLQTETEQMMERIEKQGSVWQGTQNAVNPVENMVLEQIEEEVKSRLNDAISNHDYSVADVVIDLEQTAGAFGAGTGREREWSFRRVKVTLQGKADDRLPDEYEDRTIHIEKITVGIDVEEDTGRFEDQEAETREYQRLFAQTLGIAEDRVEVTYRGGW